MKFKLNSKGVRELLQSAEMQNVIRGYVNTVESNAGGGSAGYSGNVQVGKKRAVGRVYAYNSKGIADNNENNTLLKALHD